MAKYKPFKMEGHTLPGINQKSEENSPLEHMKGGKPHRHIFKGQFKKRKPMKDYHGNVIHVDDEGYPTKRESRKIKKEWSKKGDKLPSKSSLEKYTPTPKKSSPNKFWQAIAAQVVGSKMEEKKEKKKELSNSSFIPSGEGEGSAVMQKEEKRKPKDPNPEQPRVKVDVVNPKTETKGTTKIAADITGQMTAIAKGGAGVSGTSQYEEGTRKEKRIMRKMDKLEKKMRGLDKNSNKYKKLMERHRELDNKLWSYD